MICLAESLRGLKSDDWNKQRKNYKLFSLLNHFVLQYVCVCMCMLACVYRHAHTHVCVCVVFRISWYLLVKMYQMTVITELKWTFSKELSIYGWHVIHMAGTNFSHTLVLINVWPLIYTDSQYNLSVSIICLISLSIYYTFSTKN